MNEYLEKLSEASRILEGSGLTKAGRALVKHGSRLGSIFPKPTGNADVINQVAQTVVDDILYNSRKTIIKRYHAHFGKILEIKAPDGRGIRFDSNGNFIGFLEP
jgi:filamentous hemagglutinin